MQRGRPLSLTWNAPIVVRVLDERPDLRGIFPVADVVDDYVRWNA